MEYVTLPADWHKTKFNIGVGGDRGIGETEGEKGGDGKRRGVLSKGGAAASRWLVLRVAGEESGKSL